MSILKISYKAEIWFYGNYEDAYSKNLEQSRNLGLWDLSRCPFENLLKNTEIWFTGFIQMPIREKSWIMLRCEFIGFKQIPIREYLE